jgi:hypothetical protein
LLEENPQYWDHDGVRPYARSSIAQALLCGTEALGAEVFSSILGEGCIVPNSCKSRACTSCGYWQTMRWQREVASQLPDIPYTGIILTMPRPFWGLLRKNRNLLRAIPELAAGVLTDWVRERFEAVVPVVAVMHTFNAKFEFNVHVHLVVARLGKCQCHRFRILEFPIDPVVQDRCSAVQKRAVSLCKSSNRLEPTAVRFP